MAILLQTWWITSLMIPLLNSRGWWTVRPAKAAVVSQPANGPGRCVAARLQKAGAPCGPASGWCGKSNKYLQLHHLPFCWPFPGVRARGSCFSTQSVGRDRQWLGALAAALHLALWCVVLQKGIPRTGLLQPCHHFHDRAFPWTGFPIKATFLKASMEKQTSLTSVRPSSSLLISSIVNKCIKYFFIDCFNAKVIHMHPLQQKLLPSRLVLMIQFW